MQQQRACNKCTGKLCECNMNIAIDDRSYVFLLYPLDTTSVLNPDLYTVRVPFRNMVVGILAHQMLIQTISSALLQNLNHVTPILNILQINTCSLRGILTHVNAKHISILLDCLEMSKCRAKEFDLRPGLKFLTQKVGNLSKAANLYTQANTAEVVEIIVLIELCLDGIEKYEVSPQDLKEVLQKEEKRKLLTDLDYVEQFLRDLRKKWDNLCDSYMCLSINIPEGGNESEDEVVEMVQPVKTPEKRTQARPFRLADLKRSDSFSSSDSESYLERDILPNEQNDEESVSSKKESIKKKKDVPKAQSLEETVTLIHHSENDNEEKMVKYKYKPDLNNIKYDTNTLLQMRASTSSESINKTKTNAELDKEMEHKVEAMLDHYKKRKPGQMISPTLRTNPFNASTSSLPPAQPVPPEIQQQRSMSIAKDVEAYKIAKVETMEACLELLCSLTSDRLAPLSMVLKEGAVSLLLAHDDKIKSAAETLLQKMNISYVDVDNFDV